MRRAGGLLVAAGMLLLAAFAFDAATLFVPALALLLLIGISSGWIWLAGRGAGVRRILEAERVVEEQPVEARIRLSAGWLGLPGAEIRDPLAGSAIALSCSAGTRRIELRILARFSTRGRVSFEPPQLRLGDQLGLAEVVRAGSGGRQELLVLPRTEPVSWREAGGQAALRSPGTNLSPEPTGAIEPDGLRHYRPGTPASRIHWPALARGAGLLERRLLPDGESSPLVILDSRGAGPAHLLDGAVRAAASLTLELARRGGCDLLLPGQRRPLHVAGDLAAWPAAHVRLALVEGGANVLPPAIGSRPRLGAIFYVSTHPLLRPPVRSFDGRGGLILVVPSELSEAVRQRAIFEVAGCTGFLLEGGRRRRREAAAEVAA